MFLKKSDKKSCRIKWRYSEKISLVLCIFGSSALTFAGGFILTENIFCSVFFAIIFSSFIVFEYINDYGKKRICKAEKEFAEALQMIISSLSAGGSMETAFDDLEKNAGKSGNIVLILNEIKDINVKTALNYPIYESIRVFAGKTGSQEIESIALAMGIVGEKGGNVGLIMRNALSSLRIKTETDEEINHTLMLPKYNQKIMTAMPFLLVLMIKAMSPDYVDILYNTRWGNIIVLIASALILLAWILSSKLCKIDI